MKAKSLPLSHEEEEFMLLGMLQSIIEQGIRTFDEATTTIPAFARLRKEMGLVE